MNSEISVEFCQDKSVSLRTWTKWKLIDAKTEIEKAIACLDSHDDEDNEMVIRMIGQANSSILSATTLLNIVR